MANKPNIIGRDQGMLKLPRSGLAEIISKTMKIENSKSIALLPQIGIAKLILGYS